MTHIFVNFIAAVNSAANAGIFDNLDMETIVAAAVTLLLIVGGYHDRKSKKNGSGETCAACMVPMLDRIEGMLKTIQPILSKHAASVKLHDAVAAERGGAMQKTLDELKTEVHELRRDLTGRL